MSDWNDYYKRNLTRKPRKELVKAISFCAQRKNALDLGSGSFIESKFLTEKGFKVVAVDDSPDSKELLSSFSDEEIDFKNISFQEYSFPKNFFDLTNAQFSLPFYGKKDFSIFIAKIVGSLLDNGIFVGQFFGVKDSWNTTESNLAFQTKEEILSMFNDLEILELNEEEKDGLTANGQLKHWHIFHFIVKKSKN